MIKRIFVITVTIAIGLTTTASVFGARNYSDQETRWSDGHYAARINITFSDYDKQLVHQYYGNGNGNGNAKRKKMPPGLTKKKSLPPGLQKQIKRNGKLPPGLEARYLPYDLERRLGRLPGEYARIRVGTDIVLIDIPTKLILDVISGVAF